MTKGFPIKTILTDITWY